MIALAKKLLEDPTIELVVSEITAELARENELRKEFYKEISDNQKAEFINGKVIIHTPPTKRHIDAGQRLLHFLSKHISTFHLGFLGYEKNLIELTRNSYEPDICFFNQDKAQHFTDDHNIFPSPDFIVEILSKKTERYDRTIKFNDYQAHNIKEYWIVNAKRKEIEQYVLKEGKYELIKKLQSGILTSEAIPGFSIETEIVFDNEKFEEEVQKETRELYRSKKVIREQETIISEKESIISEKDGIISEQESIISEKDKLLAEKDALINELKKTLGK